MLNNKDDRANESVAPRDPSPKSIAVAMVAMTRFMAFQEPGVADHLRASLDNAEGAGIGADDLSFLRLLVKIADDTRRMGLR